MLPPLNFDEVALLDTFFVDTTGGGALRFNWVHPRTFIAAELRFVSPPEIAALGGTMFSATLSLEVLP